VQNFWGGICKTSCSLTEKFDGGSKLINAVKFQGVIDETYNFRGVIAYLLVDKVVVNLAVDYKMLI